MSLSLSLLPEALAEAECVIGDYRARAAELGVRFQAELEVASAAIIENYRLWRLRPEGYRRVNLKGFPYYIAFIVENEQGIIVAVAHGSRDPQYFVDRLP